MALENEKCGKPAGALIPRWGWYWACVLEKGHEGRCQRDGTCTAHGPYVGENCPKWPECIKELAVIEMEKRKAEDHEREICMNPNFGDGC